MEHVVTCELAKSSYKIAASRWRGSGDLQAHHRGPRDEHSTAAVTASLPVQDLADIFPRDLQPTSMGAEEIITLDLVLIARSLRLAARFPFSVSPSRRDV